jgi:integrase
MANDTSARPHELLNLKIKDVKFKITPNRIQYAEILVSGKTKPRTLPLFSSIPYVKEWLLDHPTADNSESWIFVSKSNNKKKYW